MEKKNYLQPLCLVVALQQQNALMQGSADPTVGPVYPEDLPEHNDVVG